LFNKSIKHPSLQGKTRVNRKIYAITGYIYVRFLRGFNDCVFLRGQNRSAFRQAWPQKCLFPDGLPVLRILIRHGGANRKQII
jgi:hypothetical protein